MGCEWKVEVVLPLCAFFTGAPRYIAAWGLPLGSTNSTCLGTRNILGILGS